MKSLWFLTEPLPDLSNCYYYLQLNVKREFSSLSCQACVSVCVCFPAHICFEKHRVKVVGLLSPSAEAQSPQPCSQFSRIWDMLMLGMQMCDTTQCKLAELLLNAERSYVWWVFILKYLVDKKANVFTQCLVFTCGFSFFSVSFVCFSVDFVTTTGLNRYETRRESFSRVLHLADVLLSDQWRLLQKPLRRKASFVEECLWVWRL